jgi:hypothetical protein
MLDIHASWRQRAWSNNWWHGTKVKDIWFWQHCNILRANIGEALTCMRCTSIRTSPYQNCQINFATGKEPRRWSMSRFWWPMMSSEDGRRAVSHRACHLFYAREIFNKLPRRWQYKVRAFQYTIVYNLNNTNTKIMRRKLAVFINFCRSHTSHILHILCVASDIQETIV